MKTKFTWSQLLIVGGFLCVLIALLYANKKTSKTDELATNTKKEMEQAFDFWAQADSINSSFDKQTQFLLKEQIKLAHTGNKTAIDTLVKIYSSHKQPILASLWKSKLAEQTNLSSDWAETGTRFYISTQFYPHYKHSLFEKAIDALEKALELDTGNLGAKVKLGVCLVESTTEPMKGISLLKEVLQSDSTNIDAYLNLGLFAIQSGQYDKAIERFNKILSINPQYIEAYIYLGQTFANKGDKKKAIEMLQQYKHLSKDELINEQVNKYINELKTS